MKKLSLVFIELLVFAFLVGGGAVVPAQGQNNTFGSVILEGVGHIDEVVLDEARGLVYAANFSAGRVEVVSMGTNQRVSSFLTGTRPTAMTAMAMSPDNRWLVVTEVPVSGLPSIWVINLNDPGDRRQFPMAEEPLGLAFGHLGKALVVTRTSLITFNPNDGSLVTLFAWKDAAGAPEVQPNLPLEITTFPREVRRVQMTASRDHRWIFGTTDEFVFSHKVDSGRGFTRMRLRGPTETFVNPPTFDQVSASADGSYFMAGQLLMNNILRVVADTPEGDADNELRLIGGHVIDSEIDTVYASFNTEVTGDLPGQESTAILQVMDSDNLFVRRRVRIPERASGRFVTDSAGDKLYAVGQSGLIYVPLSELSSAPTIEVHPEDRNLLYEFNFCSREPITRTLRIENPDGGPASFTLSAVDSFGNPASGVLFEPAQGTTPANVQVTVDPEAFGPVQGTGVFDVVIETNAVNVPAKTRLFANIRDLDQKGNFFPMPGRLVDIVADPFRDRFYVLDQENFQVMLFDSNDFRLLGAFRTGNTPTWMAVDREGLFLLVANSRSETLTAINLNEMRVQSTVFVPFESFGYGHYPMSLAPDNANTLIATRTADPGPENGGQILLMSRLFGFTRPGTLGIFQNDILDVTALVSAPNLSGVLLAMEDGRTALWESLTQKVIINRRDYEGVGLKGAVGAGPNFYVVDNHVVNASLVPQIDLPDATGAQESSGFTLLPNGMAARSIRPVSGVASGVLHQFNPANPSQIINSVRMVDTPPPATSVFPFTRTLAGLRNGKLASIGTAGLLEFPVGYETGLDTPRIAAMVNAADFTTNMAPGGLVSIFGDNLSGTTASASGTPLPTALGNTCVSVNGAALPLLYVSPTQINAQLTFSSFGTLNTTVRNPGGISDIFVSQAFATAPAIFSVRAPNNNVVPAVFRSKDDQQLVTLSTPLRPNEVATLFLTGLGAVTPVAIAGYPALQDPLSVTNLEPTVMIGDVPGIIQFSGLAPGFVGLNQINVLLPGHVPLGVQVPITVSSGTISTTINVRIVDN